MKGLRQIPRVRIPYIPRRLTASVLLFVIGLAIAAIVVVRASDRRRVGNAFSNVHGYSLLEDGEFEQAIEQFQGVANSSPSEANPWDSLGEGYLANGMPDKALEAYSRALAIDPAYEASILGRGLALAALGRYDEALEQRVAGFQSPGVPVVAGGPIPRGCRRCSTKGDARTTTPRSARTRC